MGITFLIFATPLARECQFWQMLFARIDSETMGLTHQKWWYFIRGVEKIKKVWFLLIFIRKHENQNVIKTIGGSMIFESYTVVVVNNRIGDRRRLRTRSKKQENCDPHARRERWSQAGCHNNNYIYEIINSTTAAAVARAATAATAATAAAELQ